MCVIPPIRIHSSHIAFYKNDIVRQVVRMFHKTVNVVSPMFHHIDQIFSSLCIVYVLHRESLKHICIFRNHRAAEIIIVPFPRKQQRREYTVCNPTSVA